MTLTSRLSQIEAELARIAARRNALYAAGGRNSALLGKARTEALLLKLSALWEGQRPLDRRALVLTDLHTAYLAAIRGAERLDMRRAENPVDFAAVDRCQQNLADTMRDIEKLEGVLAGEVSQQQQAAE